MKVIVDPLMIFTDQKAVVGAELDYLYDDTILVAFWLSILFLHQRPGLLLSAIARYKKKTGDNDIVVATNDIGLQNRLREVDVKCIDLRSFPKRPILYRHTRRGIINRFLFRFLLAELIIFIPAIVAVAVFSGVTLLLGNLPDVLAVLPQGLSYVLVPAIGFLSFYWRQRWRLSYGLFEVMIGVYTPIRAIGGAEFKYLNLTPLDYLQIIGGIYVIVRGLDNVGVGLRGTPLEPFWSSVFSPKKKALE